MDLAENAVELSGRAGRGSPGVPARCNWKNGVAPLRDLRDLLVRRKSHTFLLPASNINILRSCVRGCGSRLRDHAGAESEFLASFEHERFITGCDVNYILSEQNLSAPASPADYFSRSSIKLGLA